jgi:hypothetical protein
MVRVMLLCLLLSFILQVCIGRERQNKSRVGGGGEKQKGIHENTHAPNSERENRVSHGNEDKKKKETKKRR